MQGVGTAVAIITLVVSWISDKLNLSKIHRSDLTTLRNIAYYMVLFMSIALDHTDGLRQRLHLKRILGGCLDRVNQIDLSKMHPQYRSEKFVDIEIQGAIVMGLIEDLGYDQLKKDTIKSTDRDIEQIDAYLITKRVRIVDGIARF